MSYCRFSDDSDVYLFPTDEGITCHDCALNPDRNPWFDLPAEALNHLYNHREAGHKVPQKAIDRLIQEMEEK